ncbi:ester cyclase [Peribacillus sp. FSL E2-0218]|uniref:nuclear transport factor 2 family protein n=1 Tax=Peribacillus sp. FSL E2-0218 TaxID=2921364 RepID=UPI0030EB377F
MKKRTNKSSLKWLLFTFSSTFISLHIIQHNPEADNGPEAFIGFGHALRGENPEMKLEIKRIFREDDYVVTHSHLILNPNDPGLALADFFLLEDGKVVEHWDVIQTVPEKAKNTNSMF